ncbi:peptidoglycan bridge formation glycyltransferase FemA/FemB family protein [Candidatus Nomurabacteria bacterium]|nr:peptidoglycan bridge formation glycyltransferase FemA/FemB family protein [Candidatus Nomurabacteria bacterium]
MEYKVCEKRGEWENGLNKHFLQSFDWGESKSGTIRVQMLENGQVVGQFQGFEVVLPLGLKFLTIPRAHLDQKLLVAAVDYLKGSKKYFFVRIEPLRFVDGSNLGAQPTRSRQWQHTLVFDVSALEDALLESMHSKTRYNIRLAMKKGVEIRETDVETFWKLSKQTAQRDGIRTDDRSYYENMVKVPGVRLLGGFLDGEPLCAGIFIQYNGRMTYVHGASSNEKRNVMAPYLLQWEAIKMAKAAGCKEYDFGGIAAPEGDGIATQMHGLHWDINDKLTGVTRFKAGFGGKRESYGDAFEVPLKNFWYKLFELVNTFR